MYSIIRGPFSASLRIKSKFHIILNQANKRKFLVVNRAGLSKYEKHYPSSHFPIAVFYSSSTSASSSSNKSPEISKFNPSDSFLSGTSSNYIEELYNDWLNDPTSVAPSWDKYFRKSPSDSSHEKKTVDQTNENKTADESEEKKKSDGGSTSTPSADADDTVELENLASKSVVQSRTSGLDPKEVVVVRTNVQRVLNAPKEKEVPVDEEGLIGKPVSPVSPYGVWIEGDIDDHLAVQNIIRSYQIRGHLAAQLDPLDINNPPPTTGKDGIPRRANEYVLRQHSYFMDKIAKGDVKKVYRLPVTSFIGTAEEKWLPLEDILDRLEKVYCGTIGVEYMHITSLPKCQFLRKHFEPPGSRDITAKEKIIVLHRLTRATGFETFLKKKYSSEKRFGLEGAESFIPCVKKIIDISSLLGVNTIIMGMAHRGRLNTLANVARKPLGQIFTQFFGLSSSDLGGSGDVKYHLGTYTERLNRQTSKTVRIVLVANPSHLEHVDAIALGRTRAEQFYHGDCDGSKVMSVLIHGDASFSGQGIVYESIILSNLKAYKTFGTIHIVINNQIGFTTDPSAYRSSKYCTEVAKVVEAPILHVNGDDIEAVNHCAKVAAEWRAEYKRDVVIDIVCYRKHGHNEMDEPMFTQPVMYKKIREKKSCLEIYADKLIKEGVISAQDSKGYYDEYQQILEKEFQKAKTATKLSYKHWLDSPWSGFFEGKDQNKVRPTGVKEETLVHIGTRFSSPPPNADEFFIHEGLQKILAFRMNLVKKRIADWALGEAFAIGTLLKKGIHVRLCGQDVERGTFSHRHHILHHQTIDKVIYSPMDHLYPDQARYTISNSPLSEAGVLGFEHGYSMANPYCLLIWEAQFGDFCDTAQSILDAFISNGEAKWVRQCGMVLLLPHAIEGMGPDHSSARVERFLQMADDDEDVFPEGENAATNQLRNINWIVANCTTPANFFHLLRRQIALPFRKPLIVMSPKSLLRHPDARSSFDDFLLGTEFQRVIPECGPAAENPESVKKLVFCSGHVFVDLLAARRNKEMEKEIAITRIEQICPFPFDLVKDECERFPEAELIWAQEEHKNQGAWSYVRSRFATAIGEDRNVCYIGRGPAAAAATGNKVQFNQQLVELLTAIFGDNPLTPKSPPKGDSKGKGGTKGKEVTIKKSYVLLDPDPEVTIVNRPDAVYEDIDGVIPPEDRYFHQKDDK